MGEEKHKSVDTQDKTGSSGVTFRVPLPLLVLGVIVLLVTLGWAHYMGFMVGMGEDPKTKLENILSFGHPKVAPVKEPAPENEKKDIVKDGEPSDKDPVKEPKASEQENASPVHPFTRPTRSGLDAWGKNVQKTEEKTQEQKKGAVQDTSGRKDVVKNERVKKETDKKTPQKKEPEKKKEPGLEVIYQVATFPSQADADNFKKKWDKSGVFRVKKYGALYRVIVPFRGTTREAKAMKAKYPGIKQWMIISSQSLDGQKAPAKQGQPSR